MYPQIVQNQRQDIHPAYALIAANQAKLPVSTVCKTLKVSASGLRLTGRPMCQRQQANVPRHQNGGAIGNHSHEIIPRREVAYLCRIMDDFVTGCSNSGRISPSQVALRGINLESTTKIENEVDKKK